jgi:hypothetical protein
VLTTAYLAMRLRALAELTGDVQAWLRNGELSPLELAGLLVKTEGLIGSLGSLEDHPALDPIAAAMEDSFNGSLQAVPRGDTEDTIPF